MTVLRPFISFAVCAVVLACTFAILILPRQAQVAADKTRIVNLQSKNQDLSYRISQIRYASEGAEYPSGAIWPAATKVDAELALQDKVFGIANTQGVNLVNFAPSSMMFDSTQSNFAFEFEAEGSLQDIYAMLTEIEAMRPIVAINQLRLRTQRQYSTEDPQVFVYMRAVLWGLWGEVE